jgi:hypothetical protein
MSILILAYIDPGSGALLLQALVAGAVGAVAIFRRTLTSIAARLLGRSPSAAPEPGIQDPEPPQSH